MSAAYEFYLAGIESALGRTDYLAGDALSIADIAFVCDLAQFLGERRGHRRLASVGLEPISRDGRDEYPRAYGHMLELSETDAFSRYFAGYLDRERERSAR